MPSVAKYLCFTIVLTLTACIPDMTDESDFYALCTRHVEGYINNGDRVVPLEFARKDAAYEFSKGPKSALITVMVKTHGDTDGEVARGENLMRRCSFQVAKGSWEVK